MPEETAPKDARMNTILGGEEIEVVHLPPEAFAKLDEFTRKRLEKFQPLLGTTARVLVRHVLVSQMQRYGHAILSRDEAAAIEIYCGKDPGWADTLTPDSVNAVADKGLEINLPFFAASFRRQTKWTEAQTPEEVLKMREQLASLEKKFSESLSPTLSEASPSITG